jgi:hypothetical protein
MRPELVRYWDGGPISSDAGTVFEPREERYEARGHTPH